MIDHRRWNTDEMDGERGGRRRMCHVRRIKLGIALAIVVVAGLATQGCILHAGRQPHPAATPLIEKYPPLGGAPVLLDHRFPDWETSAWLSTGVLCLRAARTADKHRSDRENQSVSCDPAPVPLRGDGPPDLSTPVPQVMPMDPASKELLLIGTVRGAVATVDVTMFGVTATGTVRRLPTADDRQLGAYAVWLPRSGPGKDGMRASDITAVVGRDQAGKIVVELP